MDTREEILRLIGDKKIVTSAEIAGSLKVSRQHASGLLRELLDAGKVVKAGSTKNARYALPEFSDELGVKHIQQSLLNHDLREHVVMENTLVASTAFKMAPENIQSILRYAFSEMLNNAIEHSHSSKIEVEVIDDDPMIKFVVNDFGVGVFRNVMKKRGLKFEMEAMQDLLKGRTTTSPKAHSGEGIFFTSKVADKFVLESFSQRLVVDNTIPDVFFEIQRPSKRGTRVIFSISKESKRHLSDVFKRFQSGPGEYDFGKTEILVRLFTLGTIYISRSQARRILVGLEKFKSVVLDFDRVPTVGQAFADEIFRVFKNSHPEISIQPINMNEPVKFMIERATKQ